MPVTSAVAVLLLWGGVHSATGFNPPGTLEAALQAFHQGQYEPARKALLALPESSARNTFLGLSEVATGRCDAALPRLAQVSEAQYLRLAGLGIVQCHLAAGRMNEALPILTKLQSEYPADPDVLYQAARLHMRGFNDAVAAMFRHAPASYRASQLSGEVFELQGRHAEAIAEYRKAIAKNPAAVNLHYRLGRALALQSQYDEAVREFEAELKLNPSDAFAHYQIAQILAVQGRAEDAAARHEKALQLKPDFVEGMVALAKLRPARGIELLEKAVALAPRHEPARYALLIAYRNAGRIADAQKQKAELDKLQQPAEGEFTEFLKKLGEKPAQ